MPLYGHADVVEHRARSRSAGSTSRIVSSTAAKRCSVSSMRVPGGAADVQPDQPGVDGREEVLADQRDSSASDSDDEARRTPRSRRAAVRERPGEQRAVRGRAAARSRDRTPAKKRAEQAVGAPWLVARACVGLAARAGSAPASARACATGSTRSASRRRPPAPAARTATCAGAGEERRPARRRCRCTASTTNAGTAICCAPSRIALHERLALVAGCGGCSRSRPWRRRPGCRPRAPARRASSR